MVNRDENSNVFVHLNNTVSSWNDENEDSQKDSHDHPYDFHSMINHQQSRPVNSEKPIVLLSDGNDYEADYSNRDRLSPLDVYKVQRFYSCAKIQIPDVMKAGDSIEAEMIETIQTRFKLESELKVNI